MNDQRLASPTCARFAKIFCMLESLAPRLPRVSHRDHRSTLTMHRKNLGCEIVSVHAGFSNRAQYDEFTGEEGREVATMKTRDEA